MSEPNVEPGEIQNVENPQSTKDSEPKQEEGISNEQKSDEVNRGTEKENVEEQKNERTMSDSIFNKGSDKKNIEENNGNVKGIEQPKDNGKEDVSHDTNNLSCHYSMIRSIIFFVVGCIIVSDLTGIVLWQNLENTNL